MSDILSGLDSLHTALGTLFSVLPAGWGSLLATGLIVFMVFALVKVALDVIGSFL